MSSSVRLVKKWGFFFSLVMMVGAIVGITIFFKNGQVFNAVDGDSSLILSAWITGAIIAFLTAMSFIDVVRLKNNSKMPFRKWCSMFVSKKYSDFVGTIALLYAYALVLPVLYYYSYSFLVQSFGGEPTLEGGAIALVIIPIGLFLMNIKAENGSSFFTKITTILKIFPLLLAGLVGLFFTSNNGGVSFDSPTTLNGTSSPSGITLLFALPGILFAFDGFLTVSNIAHKVKNSQKNIPLAMIIGMSFITVLYVLVTVSQINHNAPIISVALERIFDNKAWARVTLFFIAISAFGVSNIVTMSAKITCQSLIDDDVVPFSYWYKKKFDQNKDTAGGFIMLSVVIFSGLLVMFIQSSIIGSGLIEQLTNEGRIPASQKESRNITFTIDEFSNYPTYFFYPIYLSVIMGNNISLMRGELRKGALNSEKKEFKELYNTLSKKRRVTQMIISSVASLAIIAMFCIYFCYNIIYERIAKPLSTRGYLNKGEEIDVIIFFTNLVLVTGIPALCEGIKKIDNIRRKKQFQSRKNMNKNNIKI